MECTQAVKWFSKQMLNVLNDNDHKAPICKEHLIKGLFGEAIELHKEMLSHANYESDDVVKEAVDVANYALMIALDAKGKSLPQKHFLDPNWRYG